MTNKVVVAPTDIGMGLTITAGKVDVKISADANNSLGFGTDDGLLGLKLVQVANEAAWIAVSPKDPAALYYWPI